MASIHEERVVDVSAAKAWSALSRVADAQKLFAPVLVGSELDGDIRTVQFANGMVAREQILDVDHEQRRVAYSALDAPGMTYHHASMQIMDTGPGRCLFVWITDFLPSEVRSNLEPLIRQGSNALKSNLETL